ncbi:DNA repair helicase XPD [Gracilariopsis chorda]|uniref:DNA 5'-3' helicase n=1 Tax=Gracilariopsis chorda TaxID=448386 RepID=A0A2V3INV5_9FLOR|nr:DNA repair helicase XPD [Gracilariopsis chorda]|eukprot:PXF42810.1 DNA repair helicase XPD [Gracilariopsis chorda]
MRINIDGLRVYFPYPRLYPEQYEYMCELKKTLDARGHSIIEMPTGTGKTVTLLSFITSYHLQRPELAKLIYCTRTVGEMEKVLQELKVVVKYRDESYMQDQPEAAKAMPRMLALGLTTRRNLCLHPEVSTKETREEADAACRSLTASWVRSSVMDIDTSFEQNGHGPDRINSSLCEYFEGHEKEGVNSVMPAGIYTLDDLMQFGRERKWCPYYTARYCLNFANVIVYNYQYLLDPKIAGLISKSLARESIVVFDEAHNIDTICIDALSVNLREVTLRRSLGNIAKLRNHVQTLRQSGAARLQKEYQRLVKGMSTSGILPQVQASDMLLASPHIPQDILEETVPGNIRKAEHFIQFLRRFIQYLRDKKMNGRESKQENPSRFLHDMRTEMQEDIRPLRFCSDRLKSLLQVLEIAEVAEFTPLQLVSDFATLLGTYGHTKSFGVVFEPFDERLPNIPDPVLQLACLDASLAMRPVFNKFQSVILTSGTISPLPLYAKILGFQPAIMRSLSMSMQRQAMCPLIVSRGPDQVAISSKYDCRADISVVRNYGNLTVELASIIPDGVVVFFTSYVYMEQMISMWHEMGIINRLFERKLVFIETPDSIESALALDRYRRACDTGRGAIFLCVARGKVAEGIDFDRHYGRAVLVLGVPFQYTESRVLRARLEYMRSMLNIREGDYLSFDAMRQTAQCAGRVIRNKNDYGVVIFADKRYVRADKKNKLPQWILELMPDSQVDLDTQAALSVTRMYVREMAQPLLEGELDTALLTEEQVAEMSKSRFSKLMT